MLLVWLLCVCSLNVNIIVHSLLDNGFEKVILLECGGFSFGFEITNSLKCLTNCMGWPRTTILGVNKVSAN